MADYILTTTGNVNVSTNWTPIGIPGNGDRVTINDGIIGYVPIGYNWVIGDSPDDDVSTPAIQPASSSGTGTLHVYGTFTQRGSITLANAALVMMPGSIWYHDSSQATTPSSTHYTVQIGMAADQADAKFYAEGTPESRITISNAASSGEWGGISNGATGRNGTRYPSGSDGFDGGGLAEIRYCDISDAGQTGRAWWFSNPNTSTSVLRMKHVTLTNCTHDLHLRNWHADMTFDFSDIVIHSTRSGLAHLFDEGSSQIISSEGSRVYKDSFINGCINGVYAIFDIFDNVQVGGSSSLPVFNDSAVGWRVKSSADAIMVHDARTSDQAISGPGLTKLTRFVSCKNSGPTNTDADQLTFNSASAVGGATVGVAGGVFQSFGADTTAGEIIKTNGNPGTRTDVEITNCIALVGDGLEKSIGRFFTAVTGGDYSGWRVTVENTTSVGTNAKTCVLEGITGTAGCIKSVKNNYIYHPISAAISKFVSDDNVGLELVSGTIAVADYNGSNANVTTSDMYDFDDDDYGDGSYTPGQNDSVIEADFTNPTITYVSWANEVLDETFTDFDDVWAYFAAHSKPYDRSANPIHHLNFYDAAMLALTPTNAAMGTSGEDGTYLGAVDVVAANDEGGIVSDSIVSDSIVSDSIIGLVVGG